MIDQVLRAQLAPSLDRVAYRFAACGVPALGLTAAGLLVGLVACVAIAESACAPALMLWLVNRVLDGLDGPIARRRGATELGGLPGLRADFVVYSGFRSRSGDPLQGSDA